jgi:hypothetical protein
MPGTSIEQKLKGLLVDGLAAWQSIVPKSRIIPMQGRVIPQKPYIAYRFVRPWQYPGARIEHNPPTRAGEMLEPIGDPIRSGTVTDLDTNARILIDRNADFIAAGVRPSDEVKIGSKTSYVMRVRAPHKLELRHPIATARNVAYTVKHQVLRVYYVRSSLKGLIVQVVAATPQEADDLADTVLNFFKLPSGCRDALATVHWRVQNVGDMVNVDKEENGQIVARVRDLTVTLRGHELLSETRPPISMLGWDVAGHLPSGLDPDGPWTQPRPQWPDYFIERPFTIQAE